MNRQERRLQEKAARRLRVADPSNPVGMESHTDAGKIVSAGYARGIEFLTRDWNESRDEDHDKVPCAVLDPEIVSIGVKNIKENSKAIKEGLGINNVHLKKNDIFFLVGAGAGAKLTQGEIREMSRVGTVVTTNRGIKLFSDLNASEFLDFAFLVDSKLDIFTKQDWWERVNRKNTGLICSFNVHPSVIDGWSEVYWYGTAWGRVPEWQEAIDQEGIEQSVYGVLDSGLCSVSSQLHWVWKNNPEATIVLIGHDFSYHNGMKYFDTPFKATKQEIERVMLQPDFAFDIMPDKNGNFVITQEYLKAQAQVLAAQIMSLTKGGAKIFNASEGGILYIPEINQVKISEFLWEDKR